jgi:photosystem II stability/assembly factor-like uncharacterized protein
VDQPQPAKNPSLTADGRPTAARDRRILGLVAAVAVALVSSVYAIWFQPLRPNAWRPPAPVVSLDWWLYPLESNAAGRLPEVEGALNAVWADARTGHVWVVGQQGLILSSADGGRSWNRQTAPVLPPGSKVPEENQESPKEKRSDKKAQAPGVGTRQVFAQPRAVDPGQVPARGPESAAPAGDGAGYNLYAVAFRPGGVIGWAVGSRGVVLTTEDGGRSWSAVQVQEPDRESLRLIAVHAADQGGWLVDHRGCVFSPLDGGRDWSRDRRGYYSVSGASVLDDGTAWMAGPSGLYRCRPGEKQGQVVKAPEHGLFGVSFLDARTGWAVGAAGTALKTVDGETWTALPAAAGGEQATALRAVRFLNPNAGVAVGDGAGILTTLDGGLTWATARTDGIADTEKKSVSLRAVGFVDARTGWAVGTGGVVLETRDGGRSWYRLTRPAGAAVGPYGRWLAPWYLLSWVAVGLLLVPALRKPPPAAPEDSVVAAPATDKPIEAQVADRLGFYEIARGLSRFLRNEKTLPPLTVAVTGPWGSGKSSFMNLLRADVRRLGFRPVWFNAWHHQKEDDLLAALLVNVIRQGVPPWYTPEGLRFRAQLFALRVRDRLATVLAALFAFGLSVSYFVHTPDALTPLRPGEDSHWATGLLKRLGELDASTAVLGSTLVGSGLVLLRGLTRGLSAFGVNPGDLLASLSPKARVRDLEAKAGFRYEFAGQFAEVARALDPRTMLILIDDLDRCRPENVLAVLEAVNFLVSSGDCFVILGMDRVTVERCVGLGFEKVAAELVDDPAGERTRDQQQADAREKRRLFAKHYLEKLINFEVQIPTRLTEGQSLQLLAMLTEKEALRLLHPAAKSDPEDGRPSPRPLAERLAESWRLLRNFYGPLIPALLIILAGVAGYAVGVRGERPAAHGPAAVRASGPGGPAAPKVTVSPDAEPTTPGRFERGTGPGRLNAATWALLVVLWGMVLTLGTVSLLLRPDPVVRDSPAFRRALGVWQPLLLARRPTPRTLKQFVNRLRYAAMRLRADEPEPTFADRILSLLGRPFARGATPPPARPPGREAGLVASSVLYDLWPTCTEEQWRRLIREGTVGDDAPPSVRQAADRIECCLERHRTAFPHDPPIEAGGQHFSMIASGFTEEDLRGALFERGFQDRSG